MIATTAVGLVGGLLGGVIGFCIGGVAVLVSGDPEHIAITPGTYTTQVAVYSDTTVEGSITYIARRTICDNPQSPLYTEWEYFSMYDTVATERIASDMCILPYNIN